MTPYGYGLSTIQATRSIAATVADHLAMVSGVKRSSESEEPYALAAMSSKQRVFGDGFINSSSRLSTDFFILNEIGRGTFGSVFRAQSKLDGVIYAIKRSRRRFRGAIDKQKMINEVHFNILINIYYYWLIYYYY